MNRIVARIALPIVSAGVLSGAALGLAGMAGATVAARMEGFLSSREHALAAHGRSLQSGRPKQQGAGQTETRDRTHEHLRRGPYLLVAGP